MKHLFGGKLGLALLLMLLIVVLFSIGVSGRERVGVLGFQGEVDEEYLLLATNSLNFILVRLNRFQVLERQRLDLILKEQHFQQTGLVERETIVEIGKIAGIHEAFLGSIDYLFAQKDGETYRGEARITISVVEVLSGRILHTFEAYGYSYDDSQEGALYGALDDCFTEPLINSIRKAYSIISFILYVQGDSIYSLGGSEIGIERGFRYRVLRAQESGFSELIGMMEVVEVTRNESKSKVIWSKTPFQKDDEIIEMPYHTLGSIWGDLSFVNYSFDTGDGVKKELAPFLEVSYGRERPFSYNWRLHTGISSLEDILLLQMGGEVSFEIPLQPGVLYLGTKGGLGGSLVSQYSLGGDGVSSAGLYVTGGCHLKYYQNYDAGIRFLGGIRYQYGPSLNHWYSEGGERVTSVHHPKISFSGVSLHLGAGFPFEFHFFKIFNLPRRFIRSLFQVFGIGNEDE